MKGLPASPSTATCQVCGLEPGIADDLRACDAHLPRGGECGQLACKSCRTDHDDAGVSTCTPCIDYARDQWGAA